MASQQLRALSELIKQQRDSAAPNPSVQERREGMEVGQAGLPIPDDIKTTAVDIAGIAGLWVEAPGADSRRTIVYYHGGGYIMGSLNTHKEFMGRLSRACKAKVLGVDYRLAPEHVYPAAVEDGVISYQWLLDRDIDPSSVMLAGDSAGGGLVLATLISLRDRGASLPAGAILFSPWADLTTSGESVVTRADADPMLREPMLLEIAEMYYAKSDPSDPLISPVFADLTGLPPMLIQVGDAEVLLSDSIRLAENAKQAGVTVSYRVWPEAFHVFQMMPQLPESIEALEKVGDYIDELIR